MNPQQPRAAVCLTAFLLLAGLMLVTSGANSSAEQPASSNMPAEGADEALRRKVLALVEQLDAATARARQDAQDSLTRLGPAILPLLPAANGGMSAEQARRLQTVRDLLEEERAHEKLKAATVTLHAKGMKLSGVIRQIRKQTGNAVEDGRELEDGKPPDPKLSFELDRAPFWKALDEVCKQAELTANLYTGEHKIVLAAMPRLGPSRSAAENGPRAASPTSDSGPFRVGVKSIQLRWDAEEAKTLGTIQFSLAWEPRLNPLVLQVAAANFQIFDDAGTKVAAASPEEKHNIPIDPANIAMDLPLQIVAPRREARKLAAIRGQFTMITPAEMQTLKFKNLLAVKNEARKTSVGSVTLQKFEANGPVWTADILIEYEPGGLAGQLDTHIDWTAGNQIALVKPDGTRFEHNGGLQTLIQEPGRIGIEYIFTDAPGKPEEWELSYQTPGRLIAAPVWFDFRNLVLP